MFRIKRREEITDIFEEKKQKGFTQIKPSTDMDIDELRKYVFNEINSCHKEIMKSMSD